MSSPSRESWWPSFSKVLSTPDAPKSILIVPIIFAYRHTTAVRQNIISVFLGRFTLTEAEVESITSRDVPVGKQLFAAMDRAEKIRTDCQILLSGEDGSGTKAGYESHSITPLPPSETSSKSRYHGKNSRAAGRRVYKSTTLVFI